MPQLNDTMVVVMDNLNLHCSDEVRTAIENTGAKLIFLIYHRLRCFGQKSNPFCVRLLREPLSSFMRLSLSLSILFPILTSLAGFMNVTLVPRSFENRYNLSEKTLVQPAFCSASV